MESVNTPFPYKARKISDNTTLLAACTHSDSNSLFTSLVSSSSLFLILAISWLVSSVATSACLGTATVTIRRSSWASPTMIETTSSNSLFSDKILSISVNSILCPRTFTWLSERPKNSIIPASSYCPTSPVL